MRFSPYLLLRHPTYALTHLDAFSIDLSKDINFEELEAEKRKVFLSFIQSKDLLLSLPFSSKTFYQSLSHYEFQAAVKIRKKEKHTERALTKYLLRMALNPSPLAAFAKSQFVDWEYNTQAAPEKYSLNLSLVQRKEFFDLCYCDVALQGTMRYRMNPSLSATDSAFTYLFFEDGEASQVQIEKDAQFEACIQELDKRDFTFEEFSEATSYDVNDFLEAQLIIPSYPAYKDIERLKEILHSVNERHSLSFELSDIIGKKSLTLDDTQALELQKHWTQQIQKFAKSLAVGLDHKAYSERLYYLNTYSDTSIKKPEFDKAILSVDILKLASLLESCTLPIEHTKISKETIYDVATFSEVNYDLDKAKFLYLILLLQFYHQVK